MIGLISTELRAEVVLPFVGQTYCTRAGKYASTDPVNHCQFDQGVSIFTLQLPFTTSDFHWRCRLADVCSVSAAQIRILQNE